MATQRKKLVANPIKRLDFSCGIADMVDSGTTGTFTSTGQKLPAGCIVEGVKIVGGDFSGDTTASVLVGKTGATDDFSGAAKTGFAAAGPVTAYGTPATIAEKILTTETAVVITVTGASDFTLIVSTNNPAARLYISVYYLDLSSKFI